MKNFLLAVSFIIYVVALAAAGGGGCDGERAGTKRCSADSAALQYCDGSWRHLRHCRCKDGRCLPGALISENLMADPGSCDAGARGCSDDCTHVTGCSAGKDDWVPLQPCAAGTLCKQGKCVDGQGQKCDSVNMCALDSVGYSFPAVGNCKEGKYWSCEKEWDAPVTKTCPSGTYFHPCYQNCTTDPCTVQPDCNLTSENLVTSSRDPTTRGILRRVVYIIPLLGTILMYFWTSVHSGGGFP